MAIISITPANVTPVSGANNRIVAGIAGETITAGMAVYRDPTTKEFMKAQADAADSDEVFGIALNGASDGQPIDVLTEGDINIGGTVAVGEAYFLDAATAGGICPDADVASTEYVSFIGLGITTGRLRVKIVNSGVQHA